MSWKAAPQKQPSAREKALAVGQDPLSTLAPQFVPFFFRGNKLNPQHPFLEANWTITVSPLLERTFWSQVCVAWSSQLHTASRILSFLMTEEPGPPPRAAVRQHPFRLCPLGWTWKWPHRDSAPSPFQPEPRHLHSPPRKASPGCLGLWPFWNTPHTPSSVCFQMGGEPGVDGTATSPRGLAWTSR